MSNGAGNKRPHGFPISLGTARFGRGITGTANDEHVALLKQGVDAWNEWRDEEPRHPSGPQRGGPPRRQPQRGGPQRGEPQRGGPQRGEPQQGEPQRGEPHRGGPQRGKPQQANLSEANLSEADLRKADLAGRTSAGRTSAGRTSAGRTSSRRTSVGRTSAGRTSAGEPLRANLSRANLIKANLREANLSEANLSGADLSEATSRVPLLVDTDLTGADLTGCRIYGVSAWGLKLERTKQQNLVITHEDEPEITVDNIEVAQFIYLMLNNQKIRDVIDTITSKAVLILGRFTDERKAVLDALREELRKRNYLPILFDFDVPARRNITETITLLARMARFIIADLTDPSSIPQELQAIIPSVRVPVQPLLLEGSSLYSMFKDFDPQDFHWVLPVYQYKELEQLLATLAEKVIAPAEGKVKALQERRRMIEAELTKPQ